MRRGERELHVHGDPVPGGRGGTHGASLQMRRMHGVPGADIWWASAGEEERQKMHAVSGPIERLPGLNVSSHAVVSALDGDRD